MSLVGFEPTVATGQCISEIELYVENHQHTRRRNCISSIMDFVSLVVTNLTGNRIKTDDYSVTITLTFNYIDCCL